MYRKIAGVTISDEDSELSDMEDEIDELDPAVEERFEDKLNLGNVVRLGDEERIDVSKLMLSGSDSEDDGSEADSDEDGDATDSDSGDDAGATDADSKAAKKVVSMLFDDRPH